MRIIVAGGRDFNNNPLLFGVLDKAFGNVLDKIVIISGHARGADKAGEAWAISRGLTVENKKLEIYPVTDLEWHTLGPKAGIIRNHRMGDIATHLVLFWDGKSRGSLDMKDYALKKGLWVKIVPYSSNSFLCEHANECPVVCTCPQDCYCKSNTCAEN